MRKITDKIREKKRLWLSRGLLFISLFLLFALVSCEIFNQSTRGYLDYYSGNALFGRMHVEEADTKGDYSGIICIESNSDKVITLYMSNPKEYDLYFFPGGELEPKPIEFDDPRLNNVLQAGEIIFEQDSIDKTHCSLLIKKSFLESK